MSWNTQKDSWVCLGGFLDVFVHMFILRKFRKHRKALQSKNLIIFIIFVLFFFPIWVLFFFFKELSSHRTFTSVFFNVIILTIMPSIKMLSEAGKKKSDSPVQPSEGMRQWGHFNSRFLASRTVRERISATLRQQEQK